MADPNPYLHRLVEGRGGSSCQGPPKATAQVCNGEGVPGPHMAGVGDLGALHLQHTAKGGGQNKVVGGSDTCRFPQQGSAMTADLPSPMSLPERQSHPGQCRTAKRMR